jgi:hypothetical protein
MKRSILTVLFSIILLVSLVSLAGCNAKANAQDVGNPGQSNAPTPTVTPKPQITEEFKAAEPNTWSDPVFITGNTKLADITTQSNSLNFTLKDVETYVYKFYDKSAFEDAIVEAQVSNLGDNENGIALICRASDMGWYEYRVSSGGIYSVYIFDQKLKDRGENPYKMLDSGGSGLISAKDTQLKFVCQGSSLKIFAGNQEIKPPKGPIEDSTFTKGKVGVGAFSFSRVPVKISFNKFQITQPQ